MKGGYDLNNTDLKMYFLSLKKGNTAAFEIIYNEMKIPVYTVIFRTVNNKDIAEEILQDVFVRLYFNPPDDSVKNIRAWIFTVAHNLSVDVLRREIKKNYVEKAEPCNSSFDEIIFDIPDALNLLEKSDRMIVVYHINADLKFKEIAKILKMPTGSVLWRYYKAIDKMKKYLTGGE